MYVYRNLKIKSRHVWKISERPVSAASNPQVASVTLANVSFHFLNGQCRFMEKTRAQTGAAHRQVGVFAVGEIVAGAGAGLSETEITYNPNRDVWHFTTRDGRPITFCEYVRFDSTGAWAFGEIR
jgi:hypothetical protein